jgi:hypothetical protein
MSVDTNILTQQKAAKYGANVSAADFIQKCTDSINYTLADIDMEFGTQTIIDPNSLTITFAPQYGIPDNLVQSIISMGMDWYLGQCGVWTIEPNNRVEQRYRQQLKKFWGIVMKARHIKAELGDLNKQCLPVTNYPNPIMNNMGPDLYIGDYIPDEFEH